MAGGKRIVTGECVIATEGSVSVICDYRIAIGNYRNVVGVWRIVRAPLGARRTADGARDK